MSARFSPSVAIAKPAALVAHRPAQDLVLSLWLALRLVFRVLAWTVLILGAIAALYLIKSALGIDLLPGPSPLHDLLFPLIRR